MTRVLHSHLPPPARLVRVGFVPLTDCAPVVMAQELGLYGKYGLRVSLQRELGWATIRDKIIYGELDAAHALAAMPLAATLGLGSIRCECLTGLVLNVHGNALTLANELRRRGIVDAASLAEAIRQPGQDHTYTFGSVAPFSSHSYLLRKWLLSAGLKPERDVRVVIVPPPQMVANLKAGHLDGFCVGEPWNSVAVQARAGWCAAVSAELTPGHPEKVLMVRSDFAQKRSREHTALIAALSEACEFCQDPQNRERVVQTLARNMYVNAPETALRRGLSGQFDFGAGQMRKVPNFTLFHGEGANEPCATKAGWVLEQLREAVSVPLWSSFSSELTQRVFRADIYEEAVRLRRPAQQTKPRRQAAASLVH